MNTKVAVTDSGSALSTAYFVKGVVIHGAYMTRNVGGRFLLLQTTCKLHFYAKQCVHSLHV